MFLQILAISLTTGTGNFFLTYTHIQREKQDQECKGKNIF